MPITTKYEFIPFMFILLISVTYTEQHSSSQLQTLLRIQSLLNHPHFLTISNNVTDICKTEPTTSLTLICYQENLTQLHIVGPIGSPPLPETFSIDSFVTALLNLPNLKVLKLISLGIWGQLPNKFTQLSSIEILNLTGNFFQGYVPLSISSLIHLQTLILDNNNFTGTLPEQFGSLSVLSVLSIKNNSLYSSLPNSLGSLQNLRVLILSNNKFSGEVPDISSLTNLQMLDLRNNALGPRFPLVCDKVESILLRNNRFGYGIPDQVQSYYRLKELDISLNKFVGPFPVSLLSLQSLTNLDIARNEFTGLLFENLPCNDELAFVNLSSNLLTGKLPRCFEKRVAFYGDNCLETGDENQQPVSFCNREALAVGNLPRSEKSKRKRKAILGLSICGGVLGSFLLICATVFVVKKFLVKTEPRTKEVNVSADARYVTRTMKLRALGIPAYRTFSLEELEEATNNFDTSTFMGEGTHGQMYKGRLRDGSFVAIRCLKLKRNHNTQYFTPHVEMISKLRHLHLVSALGHCFEYYLDDSSVSTVFLVFEYVPNGTLRTWVSERCVQRKLTWGQRIAVATGIAKGIQFLHSGIVPGIYSNNLRITDVLVDQNLIVKISSYNLPLLAESMGGRDYLRISLGKSKELKAARETNQGKSDIYDFGVILLEVISGKRVNSRSEMENLKDELRASILADEPSRNSVIDPVLKNSCLGVTLKTMMEICYRCLANDPTERPSIEDVLWNLQFAAQVQEAWRSEYQSSDGSPISPLQRRALSWQ